jgi:hypothetical protein
MRRHGIAALAATAAVLAAGLIAPNPASAAPLVGSCFDYSAKTIRAISSPAPAIGCEAQHAAETYYVRNLPDSFGLPSASSLGARLSAAKPCTVEAMNAYLGQAGRALPSRFLSVPLFPTDPQWQAGERWMRCDVVLQGGLELKQFAGTAAALVAATPQAIFNFCTPSVPNAVATAAYPCTNPKKNWIKVLDKELGGAGSKFPGDSSVVKSTTRLCKSMGRKYNGKVPYPGWWAIRPTSRGWKEGLRSAQCFVPYKQYLQEVAIRAPKPTPTPVPAPTESAGPVPAPSASA